MDQSTLRYWIGFNRAHGVGPVWLHTLIQYFGGIENAWKASPRALESAGLNHRTINSILAVRTTCDLDAELRNIERAGAWVITWEDTGYPPGLSSITDPPPVLYVKGTLTEGDSQALAVVGTRRATAYGKTMTHEIVEPLAHRGMTIVSGLARGIDAEAHQAALDAGGRTIAVLANGIDRVYPPEHRPLAEQIAANGALVSELPLGTPAKNIYFLPRNRLISGLAMGTLVVEAAERSGALTTANLALEQGRDVFAVPGNALSPSSKGTNLLIQSGAVMVTTAEDILNALTLDLAPLKTHKPSPRPENAFIATSLAENEVEAMILRSLATEPQHIDSLSRQSGLPVKVISSTLTILELRGLVQQVSVTQYGLVDKRH
ncbi:MAG: DNA-processing protein DprA [Chloroflexota bacterium]